MILTSWNKKIYEDAGDAGAGGAKGGEIDDLVANMLKYAAEVGNLMKYMAIKGKLEKNTVDNIVETNLFKLKSGLQKTELLAKWDEKWAETVTKKVEKLEGDAIKKAREDFDKKRIQQREAVSNKLDIQVEQGLLKFKQRGEKLKQNNDKLNKLEMKSEHILDQKRLYDNRLAIEMIQYTFDKNKELNALKAKHKPEAKEAIAKTEARQEGETTDLIAAKQDKISEIEAEIANRDKENNDKLDALGESDPDKANVLKKIKNYNKALIDAIGDAKKLKESNIKLKSLLDAIKNNSEDEKIKKDLEDYKIVHKEIEDKYNISLKSVTTNSLNQKDLIKIIEDENAQKQYLEKQKTEISEIKNIIKEEKPKKESKEQSKKKPGNTSETVPKNTETETSKKQSTNTASTTEESRKYNYNMSILTEKLKIFKK